MRVSSFPVNGLALFQQLWWKTCESVASGHVSTESSGEVTRHGSGGPTADGTAVELGDGYHLRGGSGEEHLCGCVQIVPVHRRFFDGVSRLTSQLDHGVTRDTPEDAGIGRRGA